MLVHHCAIRDELRALSVKEYARIQEFPDTWEFVGKLGNLYRQIGNAVPVRLGVLSGEVIASNLDKVNEFNFLGINPGAKVTSSKIIYLRSHIRTRRWYKKEKPSSMANHIDLRNNNEGKHATTKIII